MNNTAHNKKRTVCETIQAALNNFQADEQYDYIQEWADLLQDPEDEDLKDALMWTVENITNLRIALEMIKSSNPILFKTLFDKKTQIRKAIPRLRVIPGGLNENI